jgi:aryl-alcohol dehydrogenase-like predicted oxidoreductase
VEYRNLGKSGLKISVLTMGTMTFGGTGGFAQVGSTGVDEARRQVDMCLDAGPSEQLADNLAAADLELSPADIERLDKVSAPVLLYPYWHQAKTARDRLSPADLTLLGPHL